MGYRPGRGTAALKLLAWFIGLLVVLAIMLGPGRDYSAYGVWWLTNDQPPEIAPVALPSAVRGTVELRFDLRPNGRVDIVGAELDGRELRPEDPLKIETSGLPDGQHVLMVRAQDRSLRKNSTSTRLALVSDNTAPRFEIQVNPPRVAQGHTAVIHIRPDEPSEARAKLNGADLALHAAGADFWAVVGTDSDEKPGQLDLVVEGHDRVGNAGRASGQLDVAAFEFTRDSLTVPQTMLPLLAPSVRASEDEHLQSLYGRPNGPPLWKGTFLLPVLGPVSTQFGEVRSYNGGPFQGHHGGTDFQVGAGQPVQAPASGRVVLREELKLRGRVLVLDHGGGVYTTYAHLSEWLVESGQEVQQRQPIGKAGSTGLSTGPHLHWELWVNGKSVDPVEWTEREIP